MRAVEDAINSIRRPTLVFAQIQRFDEYEAVGAGLAFDLTPNSESIAVWNGSEYESFNTDPNDFHSTSINVGRLTVPAGQAGWYDISWSVDFTGWDGVSVEVDIASGSKTATLLVNGNILDYREERSGTTQQFGGRLGAYLQVGDYLTLRVTHNIPDNPGGPAVAVKRSRITAVKL